MSKGMRVLLVEDNALLQKELTRAISALSGATVASVHVSSHSAIAWLDANPEDWDLAIVDMFLAQGHGFDVIKSARRVLSHQKVVMLSNYSRDQVADHALKVGADRFFDKSHELDELIQYCKSTNDALREERS